MARIQDTSFALHRDAEILRQKQKVYTLYTCAHGGASIYQRDPRRKRRKNERQLKRLGRNDPSAGPAHEQRHILFSLANVVSKAGRGDGRRRRWRAGEGAEGPNRMGETGTYSRETRPIPRSVGNCNRSYIGSATTIGHAHDMTCLGEADLDTGTDKVNLPKNNRYLNSVCPD